MRKEASVAAALVAGLAIATPMTLAVAQPAQAQETTSGEVASDDVAATNDVSGGIAWSIEGGTLTISAADSPQDSCGKGEMPDYTYSVKDGAVTADTRPWSSSVTAITKVVVNEGVTTLGNSAFREFTNLQSVNVPSSITRLGDHLFRNDKALTNVTWANGFFAPASTKDTDSNYAEYSGAYVPTSMFDGCTSLGEGIELSSWLPESFTGVSCAAFRDTQFKVDFDTLLSTHKNSEGKFYIGAYGFASMPNLDSLKLTDAFTLGFRDPNHKDENSYAFKGSGLNTLSVETSKVERGCFQDCLQLSKVTFDDGVSTISQGAFERTNALASIDLNRVGTIGESAFSGAGLTKLTFPKGLTTVSKRAFEGCLSLATLAIESDNVSVGQDVFSGCAALKYMSSSESSETTFTNSFAEDGAYGDSACTNLTKAELMGKVNGSLANLTGLKSLTINGESGVLASTTSVPSSIETLHVVGDSWSMPNYGFSNKTYPQHLIVDVDNVSPANNDGVAQATFRDNTGLETVKFVGDSVSLPVKAFMGCTGIKSVDLSGVQNLTVGIGCFTDCSAKEGYTHSDSEDSHAFSSSCVFYVKSADDAGKLRKSNPYETPLAADKGIVLVTNGGTVDDSKTPGVEAVSYEGRKATWYTSSDCTGEPATTPKAGNTYYAGWKLDPPMVETESDSSYLVDGQEGHVSVAVTNKVDGIEYKYQWSKNDAEQQGENKESLTVTGPGKYTCKVWAVSGSDESDKCEVEITIGTASAEGKFKLEESSIDLTYGGGSKDVKVNLTDGANLSAVKVSTNLDDEKVATATYKDGIVTLTPKGVGQVVVHLHYPGDQNVSTANAQFIVKVNRYVPAPSTTTTETVTNPDGSTTTTETDKSTGTVTVTNKSTDGVVTKTVTAKDAEPKVSVTVPSSVKSATVSVPVEPSEGTVVVDAKTGRVVNRCVATEDGLEVKVDGSCELVVRENAKAFSDMAGHWAQPAVDFASARGLMNGIGDTGTFEPETMTSRAMVCAVLSNLEYGPEATRALTFADTDANGWYADAVAWAYEAGIVHGYGDGSTFGPGDDVTREQMACMIYNYARALGMDTTKRADLSAYADASELTYGREAMEWCVASGVFHGYDGGTELGGLDGLTRGQCAAVLMNLVTLIVEG